MSTTRGGDLAGPDCRQKDAKFVCYDPLFPGSHLQAAAVSKLQDLGSVLVHVVAA
jgi:hypothetical protein